MRSGTSTGVKEEFEHRRKLAKQYLKISVNYEITLYAKELHKSVTNDKNSLKILYVDRRLQ